MRKNEETQATKWIHLTGSVLIGGVLALGVCLIILFVCSVCISKGVLNNQAMIQYTIAGCVIGGFSGATLSIYRVRAKTLVVGVFTACIQFLLILLTGFLIYPDISVVEHGLGIAAGCLAGGALAGFLLGKPKKKRRK